MRDTRRPADQEFANRNRKPLRLPSGSPQVKLLSMFVELRRVAPVAQRSILPIGLRTPACDDRVKNALVTKPGLRPIQRENGERLTRLVEDPHVYQAARRMILDLF